MVAENSRVWPRLRKLRADFLDVGDEAHVEHPVGFVDHQQVAIVEHDLAAAEQVHQPARRRDQHVDALFERLDLVAHLHAAHQQRHRERVVLAVFLEILGDLHRELARRLEDQRARHPRPAAALVQDVDHRQDEAGGLAGAGLGDPDQVLAHQHRRDRRALDRSRLVIAAVGDGAEQFVGKAEIGKSHSKSGRWSEPRLLMAGAAIAPRPAMPRPWRLSRKVGCWDAPIPSRQRRSCGTSCLNCSIVQLPPDSRVDASRWTHRSGRPGPAGRSRA